MKEVKQIHYVHKNCNSYVCSLCNYPLWLCQQELANEDNDETMTPAEAKVQ